MMKALFALILASSLLLVFQNCEQQLEDINGIEARSDKTVVEVDAATYVHLEQKTGANPDQSDAIFIDLEEATMTVRDGVTDLRTCDLSEETHEELITLLTDVEICKPAPLGENEVTCMALGTPDIQLFQEDGDSTWLQTNICRTGKFLCGDKDEKLRSILNEISCL